MSTLLVYDNTGMIFTQITGEYLIPQGGIQYLETEVPEGKVIRGIDVSVTPHQVILEDIPPSEIDLLKAQNTDLMLAVAELGATSVQNTIETQLAIAELASLFTGGAE